MLARTLVAACLLSVSLSACGEVRTAESEPGVTRDSAGITIVENRTPVWSEVEAWHIADAPALQMGAAEGDPDHEFFQIRGLARLSDGTIVVANGGTSQLQYYAADGTLRLRAGRKGKGPGEFTMLAGLTRLAGDSLLAIDLGQRRASVYGPDGKHVRDFTTGDARTIMSFLPAGQLDDGTYLALANNVRDPSAILSRPAGPARDSVLALHIDAAGSVVDTLGLFPGPRMKVVMMELMGRSLPMPTTVPFSSTTQLAAAGDRVYLGTSDTYEIGVYTATGTLQRLIRKPQDPRPVTEADADAIKVRVRETLANQSNPIAKQMAEAYANVEIPATMPAFSRLLVDGDRNLWVADYPGPNDSVAVWKVFDHEGRWLGSVTLPSKLIVSDIGTDYVLGRTVDDTEIEHVVVYDLIKPAVVKD